MQEKYWNYLVQTKASILYLDIYAEKLYTYDRNINVFSAIASSASIAAWAVWTELSFLWGFIIAISQVVTAVKEFFPLAKRLKLLKSFSENMKRIYIRMEYDWFQVAEGELTEREINELLFSYKKDVMDMENKYLKEEILVEKIDYMIEADKKCDYYFENNFR